MKNKIFSALGLGIIFNWLSLFFSERALPNAATYADLTKPIATAGFPLKTFEYPVPPMGNDWPPLSSLAPFLINFAIWIAVSFLVVLLIKNEFLNKKAMEVIWGLAIALSIIGEFYITFKFD